MFYLGLLKTRGVFIIGTACRTWLERILLPEGTAGVCGVRDSDGCGVSTPELALVDK